MRKNDESAAVAGCAAAGCEDTSTESQAVVPTITVYDVTISFEDSANANKCAHEINKRLRYAPYILHRNETAQPMDG